MDPDPGTAGQTLLKFTWQESSMRQSLKALPSREVTQGRVTYNPFLCPV